jgi:hypothetical protein
MAATDPDDTVPPSDSTPTIPAPPVLDDPDFDGFQIGYPVTFLPQPVPCLAFEDLGSDDLDDD